MKKQVKKKLSLKKFRIAEMSTFEKKIINGGDNNVTNNDCGSDNSGSVKSITL